MHGFDSHRGLTKMQKAAFLILILLTFLLFVSGVRAQTLTFDRAYRDYQFNLTTYGQAYSDYQNAKNAYLQGGKTLQLKDTATQKTLVMLRDRDQLMIVYLTALRTKIAESTGLTGDEKGGIFGKIDADVNFYTSHKANYKDDDSLDTLFIKNSESQSQYKDTTSLVVDEAVFDISLGEEVGIRLDHEKIYDALKNLIDAGVASGKLSREPFNHWLTDIDATDATLKQNEDAARTEIQKIYSQSYSPTGSSDASLEILKSSVIPLSQLNEFLTEVVNYIKNQP